MIFDPPLRESHCSQATFIRASQPLDDVVVQAGGEEYVFADDSRRIWMRRRDGVLVKDSRLIDLIEALQLRGRRGGASDRRPPAERDR